MTVERDRWIPILLLALVLSACTVFSGADKPSPTTEQQTARVSPQTTDITAPAQDTATVEPTATALPTSLPTVTSVPATATPVADLTLSPDGVFLHPVPNIYEGDEVTFYILADVPPSLDPNDVSLRIEVADQFSLQGALNGRNLAGEAIGLFAWAWDADGYVGDYQATITLDPDDVIKAGDENPNNNQVSLTVSVLPVGSRPAEEAVHSWVSEETSCCVIHAINSTSAHRDLPLLKAAVEDAVQLASSRLGVEPKSKIDLYFIDRVIGQGGYASSNMVISYVDRNYSGGGLHEVLVHETVHLLDRQFAPERIAFLAEGLAVWAAGGHYKQENIDQKARALPETNLYVPLRDLINDFYAHQHEVGYLQAAGFMSYLINTYGWEEVQAFYSDVRPQGAPSNADAVNQSLERHFNRSLAEVESDWLANLDAMTPDLRAVSDLLTTVRYYTLMRDYQLNYDPTAHFLQAWLPYPQELEQRQLTADVTRHPTAEINVTLEVMLQAVDRAIAAGDYSRANVILDSVERVLANGGVFIDPLGRNYREIVAKLSGLGYDVHQVELEGNDAVVRVTEGRRISLSTIAMTLRNQDWILLN